MFEAKEGMGVAIVTQKRIQNPPLVFKAREGVVVIIANKRETPPAHVCSKGVVVVVAQSLSLSLASCCHCCQE
jgi:hypothetical protein